MRSPHLAAVIALAACTSTAPVALTSIASAPRARALPVQPAGALRVMSYNVNFGIAGDEAAIAAIARARPQVVFLQETNDVWRDALVRGLPQFPHHAFAPPEDLPAGGMGVMSMYPIASIERLPSVGGPFFAQRVVVDAPQGRVQVLNVHLRPPMSDGGSWIAGFFTTREVREREMSWHASRLDPALPTVILGDFNEEGDGLALAVTDRLGYTDAIAQWLGKTRTWEWPVGALTLRFQLDHILHDARFTAAAAGIVEAGRSDHKPIWADLERVEP
ncbi:MAG: endonuclease/exonuclease/phosphatase family protein [Deltaproteobacteria bacterium]|nr:endonuclease/exonuclease/phosphatase family protein [Deltaproteobacteria bacterium]